MSISNKYLKKNLTVAFLANFIGLLCSVILSLMLPRYIGVEEYSYYQLYCFYASFVGVCGVGFVEGVYLNYGGLYYDEIDKKDFSSILKFFSVLEFFISITIALIVIINYWDSDKSLVLLAFSLCIVFYMPRALLHNLLQSTGRIKEYSIGLIIDRVVHALLTSVLLFCVGERFIFFVLSELIGRICGSVYIFHVCYDILKAKGSLREINLLRIRTIGFSGLALLASNISAMLIIGIVRFYVESYWSIDVFGKLSLTLSISGILLVFINSVSLVLFPALKRVSEFELKDVYITIRYRMMVVLLLFLMFYYPVDVFLTMWLPDYADSLKYMAILFPLCIFESKMALLINTYLKVLRKEKILFLINSFFVILSAVFSYFTCVIFHNIEYVVFSIVILVALRSIVSEYFLSSYLEVKLFVGIFLEVIMCSIFVYCGYFLERISGGVIYGLFYMMYCFLIKTKISKMV